MATLDAKRLRAVYRRLLAEYGPQHWWPGDSPFEVMIGAILTQNTAWANVERGLGRLCDRIPLTPQAILSLPGDELAACLRPVGYFNLKSQRLQAFCRAYLEAGGLAGLRTLETEALRHWLLRIHGIGPETADDMLLYAFERPVFVVDAYTRRVFERLGVLTENLDYETIRRGFETALGQDVPLFNEYHALIVRHGKELCRRTRPRCPQCCLHASCPGC
ncbi:MAG: endonuclease III domain-containing protein [Candidatus Thiosymbion ectosymbiont of Robbea hypermnestra]|nr:endonuclease III domain-containing protein [Candidatus Thiosymbion ectosymbiont of Robbea hypermnestra]